MATINWKFTWLHNDQPHEVTITGAKKCSDAIGRLKNILSDLDIKSGDTFSSWIEIENQRTMTKKWIKPTAVIKHLQFV